MVFSFWYGRAAEPGHALRWLFGRFIFRLEEFVVPGLHCRPLRRHLLVCDVQQPFGGAVGAGLAALPDFTLAMPVDGVGQARLAL
jgi:hypothetical protein